MAQVDGSQQPRVPAWKRLGLKLAHQEDNKKRKVESISSCQTESSLPRTVKRKKSVSFAEDVKEDDGSQSQQILDEYIAKQQSGTEEFTAQQISLYATNPVKSVKSGKNGTADKLTSTKRVTNVDSKRETASDKDEPTSEYLRYLVQFGNDKANWKFKKHDQTLLLKYTFSERRIPSQHFETYLTYIDGLQGQARQRLAERARAVIQEPNVEGDDGMENREARNGARQAALKQRLLNTKIRLREQQDDEELDDPAFREKFTKRRRAEEILKRLADVSAQFNLAQPDQDICNVVPTNQVMNTRSISNTTGKPGKRQRVRIKKARTGIPEDDMSSVSSVEIGPMAKQAQAARSKTANAEKPETSSDNGDDPISIVSSDDSSSSDSDTDTTSESTDTDESSADEKAT